jgi:hypothetical protein
VSVEGEEGGVRGCGDIFSCFGLMVEKESGIGNRLIVKDFLVKILFDCATIGKGVIGLLGQYYVYVWIQTAL